jgi:hypothetical protein
VPKKSEKKTNINQNALEKGVQKSLLLTTIKASKSLRA